MRDANFSQLSVTICVEDALRPLFRRLVDVQRPNLLVNMTNDAWFAGSNEPRMHLELDPRLWRARMQLAVLAARMGDGEEALRRSRQLLAEQPGNAEATAQCAVLLQDLGRHGEALELLERAIREAPGELEHHLRAADIEMNLGRSHAALAAIRRLD